MWFVRVRRANVICHVTMQRCCFVWVFFCLQFQVEIEIYSRPKTTTRNYEFFVPFEMGENTYSRPAFLAKHGSDGNPPHGQEKGPSICSAVQLFGGLRPVDCRWPNRRVIGKKWKNINMSYIYNLYTLNYNQRFQKTFLQTVPENPVLKDLLFWRWNLASALMVLKLVLHMRQVWNFHDSGVRGPNVAIFVVAMTRLFRVKINEMYHITKYDLHSYHKSFSSMLFCLASFPFQYCFNLPHFF